MSETAGSFWEDTDDLTADAMGDSSNTMPDNAGDGYVFEPPVPDDDGTSLFEAPVKEPDASVLDEPKRSKRAKDYEQRVRSWIRLGVKATIQDHPEDAAALIMYGPDIAEASGDLADDSAMVRRAIDLFDSGISNPALALVAAVMPLAMQVLRNHEPTAEVTHIIRNPITKKEKPFTVNVAMLRKTHIFSHEPDLFAQRVLSQPTIHASLVRNGIVSE